MSNINWYRLALSVPALVVPQPRAARRRRVRRRPGARSSFVKQFIRDRNSSHEEWADTPDGGEFGPSIPGDQNPRPRAGQGRMVSAGRWQRLIREECPGGILRPTGAGIDGDPRRSGNPFGPARHCTNRSTGLSGLGRAMAEGLASAGETGSEIPFL